MKKNTSLPWLSGEKANLQLTVDFYNLFNQKNLQAWDTNLADGGFDQQGNATGNFGKTLGVGQARTLQLGANLRF